MLYEIGHRETCVARGPSRHLAFAYDTKQNSSDMPRSERRQEINARPESGGYPKGDAEVVTEHDIDFHQVLTQGVDWRMEDSEHDSNFHQALTQGVDWRMSDSEHNSEHNSDIHQALMQGVDWRMQDSDA